MYRIVGSMADLPPQIVIGVIYCVRTLPKVLKFQLTLRGLQNVSAKYIYGRLMKGSRHAHSHTTLGWGVWVAVVSGIWIVAFVFGSVIPSMGDFLSLLGAAFDVSASGALSQPLHRFLGTDLKHAEFLRVYLLGNCLLPSLQDGALEGPYSHLEHSCAHRPVRMRPLPLRARTLRRRHGQSLPYPVLIKLHPEADFAVPTGHHRGLRRIDSPRVLVLQ